MKKLRKKGCLLILLVMGLSILFIGTLQAKIVYVKSYKVNVRSGPDEKSKIITQVEYGDELKIVRKDVVDNWLCIKTPDRKIGWVHKSLLTSQMPPKYKLVRSKNLDIGPHGSFRGAKRSQYDIEVPLNTEDEEVRALLRKAVKEFAAKREVDALVVRLFFEGTRLAYATTEWAPEGDWGKAESGKPKSTFEVSIRIFTEMRPGEEGEMVKHGLSLDERKKIFWEICIAQDKSLKIAAKKYPNDVEKKWEYEEKLSKKYEKKVCDKYDITEEQKDEILSEGIKNNWPMPEP